MINLQNIDLISVNCVNPEQSVKALLCSSEQITFGSIKILAHYKPKNLPKHIEYIEIPKQTHETMNWFHINTLPKYVNNRYMLSIHDDGFILNPHLWDDKFLEYDYVGAPWSVGFDWCTRNRVGNGGFVLKSKKFMNYEETLPFTNQHNDVYVTNTHYDYFVNSGCRYAPIEVAMKFSLECKIPECIFDLTKTFGYHGKQYQESADKLKLLNKYE